MIVPDDRAGRTLKCPRCDQSVVVPSGEADAASQALLSVLAEGIPAATLAAGSLRVGSVQAPPPTSTAAAAHPPVDRPGEAPRFRTVPPPPLVKPKSRVLPTRHEPAAASPEQQTTKLQKPELKSPVLKSPDPNLSEPITDDLQSIAPAAEPVVRIAHLPAADEAAKPPALDEVIGHDVVPPAGVESLAERTVALATESEPVRSTEPTTVTEATSAAANESSKSEPNRVPEPVPEPEPPAALLQPTVESPPQTEPVKPIANEPIPNEPRSPVPLAVSDERDEADLAPPFADEPAPPPLLPAAINAAPAHLAADATSALAAYQLAIAFAAAALFSVVPAVWDVVEFMRSAESVFVARWALALFFLGVVQLAYAVYLFQLPDWSSVWVVTIFSLALAAVYAAVLGLVLLSPPDGFFVGPSGLQLADKLAGGKAALWCLCMISVSTILAFFAGRLGASWHRAEMMMRIAAA